MPNSTLKPPKSILEIFIFVCNDFKLTQTFLKFIFTIIFVPPQNNKRNMKTSKYTKVAVIIMVVLFVVISVMSCTVHTHSTGSGKIPPGQAKKMSGSQSAKAYAPGQQKKH